MDKQRFLFKVNEDNKGNGKRTYLEINGRWRILWLYSNHTGFYFRRWTEIIFPHLHLITQRKAQSPQGRISWWTDRHRQTPHTNEWLHIECQALGLLCFRGTVRHWLIKHCKPIPSWDGPLVKAAACLWRVCSTTYRPAWPPAAWRIPSGTSGRHTCVEHWKGYRSENTCIS